MEDDIHHSYVLRGKTPTVQRMSLPSMQARSTLQVLFAFWQLSFDCIILAMTVAREELYMCDRSAGCIHVFSLKGVHHRTIYPMYGDLEWEWCFLENLCCVRDSLYLAEDRQESLHPQNGRHVFVMTLQGEPLQAYRHPHLEEGWECCSNSMQSFGRKLLMCTVNHLTVQLRLIAMDGALKKLFT